MPRAPELLLVEDDDGDATLFREALRAEAPSVRLRVAGDGLLALAALQAGPLPDLVVLDLKLPHVDGRDALKAIREQPGFRGLPVVVLTTSTNPEDVLTCYRLGCNAYLFKPVGFQELRAVVRGAARFWLGAAAVRAP